jgi:hypothetical protein
MAGAPPSSGGGGAAFILLFLMLVGIGVAIYYATKSDSSASVPASVSTDAPPASDSPAPTVAPVDPKAAIVANGKVLQLAEKDISISPPTELGTSGVDTTKPVAYTITMFINIEKASAAWRNIFSRGATDGDRHPSIYIRPNELTFHFRHGTDNEVNFGLDTTAKGATAGQYTHVAFVNDGAKMSVFINGIQDANTKTIDPAHKCIWGTNDTLHAAVPPGNAAAGYLKIKELYLFPMALADADIKTLSTTPVTTTSTYEVEPITATEGDYLGFVE